MLDQSTAPTVSLRAERTTALPVARMVIGMDAEEAAALLPRLFNLCRVAQSIAARLAFGLPSAPGQIEEIRQEVLREHLIKFCLKFPGHFGLGPSTLPAGWQLGSDATRLALFGPKGALPERPADFAQFLEGDNGAAHLLRRIGYCFDAGEACSDRLASVTPETALIAAALENSVAGRQAHRPVLQEIEDNVGRGPLWRATARLYDAQDCMDGTLPEPVSPRPGLAVVPAARGTYAVSATVEAGIVTAFGRVTPTDHLTATGGILDQTLARLPARKNGMAPLIMDILDPCVPVRITETQDA
jgi:hypothetical protein